MRLRGHVLQVSLLGLALAGAGLTGCGESASADSGLTAWLRVNGGQFIPGELTDDDVKTGPTVDPKPSSTRVFPGATDRTITGFAALSTSAILLGIEGDSGHWEIPHGPKDIDPQWTFRASVSYSPDIPLGKRAMRFRAVDADGNLGPIQSYSLNVDLPAPKGALVIQLAWDTEADLDLHVRILDPSVKNGYFDVWNKAPLALPPGDSGFSKADVANAGKLLFDSNASCVIDGARHEEIVFPSTFPPGPYEVRVDTASLCGEPAARWHVAAFTNPTGAPTLIQEAYGESTDRDTVAAHDAASGLLAFTFSPQ